MTVPSHHRFVLLAVLVAACTPLVEPTARDAAELQPDEQADDTSLDPSSNDDATRDASARRDAGLDAAVTREAGASRGAGAARDADTAPREAGSPEPGPARADASAPPASAPSGKKPLGATCSAHAECQYGSCEEGFCCMLSCGECQRCTASGMCEPVADAEHESCSGLKVCSAGRCVGKRGQRCTANEQCQSAVCEDQVCCTAPCSEICSRCDAESSGGSCAPYDGNDSSCPAPNTCTRGDCARIDAQSLVREFALVFGRGTSSRRRGQIITIARAGELLEVRISARCTASSDRLSATLETVGEDGNPTGTEFARVYNPTQPVVPPHGDVLGFRLLSPRTVSAGERFAFLITTSTDGSVCHIFGSDSDVYPQGYSYDEATGVPVQRLHDHWFQVLMR